VLLPVEATWAGGTIQLGWHRRVCNHLVSVPGL